jgi:hypothetical protein
MRKFNVVEQNKGIVQKEMATCTLIAVFAPMGAVSEVTILLAILS